MTHIRIYRSVGGGSEMFLMGEIEVPSSPAAITWSVSTDTLADVRSYRDEAIKEKPPLEFDHDCPSMLSIVTEHRGRIFGAINWQPGFLPGRRSLVATDAAATFTVSLIVGQEVTIAQHATNPQYRVKEAMVGWTIRFPLGSDTPYTIYDVNEATQTVRLGATLNQPWIWVQRIDPIDQALPANTDFIIEAPRGRLYWSKRTQPEYWLLYNSRDDLGGDDGEEFTNIIATERLVVTKPSRCWVLDYQTNPGPGANLRVLSNSVGCSWPHAYAIRPDGVIEFQHRSGIYAADTSRVMRISDALGNGGFNSGQFSVHYRDKKLVLHFVTGAAYVHHYATGEWVLWKWQYGSTFRDFTAGLPALDGASAPRERVFLGESTGRHWVMVDTFFEVGVADGHGAFPDTTYKPVSRCTSGAAVGTLIDTTNTFPDHTSVGASLIGDTIRIIRGTGAGQVGYVSSRASSSQLGVTGFTVALDASSVYEIGHVDWYRKTPFLRAGSAGHILREVRALVEPGAWTNDFDQANRHDHALYCQIREGLETSAVRVYEPETLALEDEGFEDRGSGVPAWRINPVLNRLEGDYSNNGWGVRARHEPHSGEIRFPAGGSAIYQQIEIGESLPSVRSRARILAIGRVTIPQEDEAPA